MSFIVFSTFILLAAATSGGFMASLVYAPTMTRLAQKRFTRSPD